MNRIELIVLWKICVEVIFPQTTASIKVLFVFSHLMFLVFFFYQFVIKSIVAYFLFVKCVIFDAESISIATTSGPRTLDDMSRGELVTR